MTALSRTPPPPLDWHPSYRGRTWLLDWLNERGPYADRWTTLIPIVRPLGVFGDEADPTTTELRTHTLTKHRCAAMAPYVGWPFVYSWNVAIDELGRCIAGESRRRYLPWEPWYPFTPREQPADEQYPDSEP